MSVLTDYFVYPHRRPGLDHDRFAHRYLTDAAPIAWPQGRLLVWVTVHLEHFPMDMQRTPFIPPGGMDRVHPSIWDYTMRDYGNRVGIFRLMKVLDRHGIRPTVAMNSVLAERYPYLLAEILKRGWEIAASGVDMGHLHHGGLPETAEKALVERSFATLRNLSGQAVLGWHSPAHSESRATPDLAAESGAGYIFDWINDDMPYTMRTRNGTLTHLPLSYELSDRKILFVHNQSGDEYERQVGAAFDCLHAESAAKGGRILSLSLAPWAIGQPSKIRKLDRVLTRIMTAEGVAAATGAEIAQAWTEQAASCRAP